jgi:hypothetical protein
LTKDDGEDMLEGKEEHTRCNSTEYSIVDPYSSPYIPDSGMSSGMTGNYDMSATTMATFDSHHLTTTHTYDSLASQWSAFRHTPTPSTYMAGNRTLWTQDVNCSVPATAYSEGYDYNLLSTYAAPSEQGRSYPLQFHDVLPGSEVYNYDPSHTPQSQMSDISNPSWAVYPIYYHGYDHGSN